MGLKEKLDNLDYGTLYDLWDAHCNQNSEPPKQWQLIEDLIGLAEGDSDVEAMILSDMQDSPIGYANLCDDCQKKTDDEESDNILKGDAAIEAYDKILSDAEIESGQASPFYNEPYSAGYFHDVSSDKWIAFDNTTKEFWVEEFLSEQEAADWCAGKFEVGESDNVSPIIIKVKSGVVVSVDNIPENCSVELWDYDTEGQSDNHLRTDSDDEKYLLNIF